MQDLVVLILAGGDGGRFWPMADKNSLSFLGKPLCYYSLSQFRKFGFKNIVIIVNDDNKTLFNNLKKEFSDLNINLLKQVDPRGMAGAILTAKEFIKGKKLLVVSASDIYEDILLSEFLSRLKDHPEAILTGIKQDVYFPGGYLKISNGKITGIIEKPNPDKIPSNVVTIVFDYFKSADSLLSAISDVDSTSDDLFEKAIELLIKKKVEVELLPYNGFWGYLKFPWHILIIMSYYLHKIKGKRIEKAVIDKSAVISGDVYIQDGVRILENAKIVGPTYIGASTIIGQNSLVRESMIGSNCVIGFSTEIVRSYIADNSWFHNNYVGDSIVSSNVSMGAGSILANLKLNESTIKSMMKDKIIDTGKSKLGAIIGTGARIGINASIMPGIKVGKNCFVGPAVVLDRDLLDDKTCKIITSNYKVEKNKTKIAHDSRKTMINNLKLS